MTEARLTPATVVLLGIDAANDWGEQSVSHIRRAPWVPLVLVEFLLDELDDGPVRKTVLRLRDEGMGVQSERVQSLIEELFSTGAIEPRGRGRNALWQIGAAHVDEVERLWNAINRSDAAAIQRASQRTVAMSDAWSNRLRAATESRLSTSRSPTPG